MNKTLKRGLAVSCLLTLMLNLTACGYLLYPERKGQSGGRVDPVVVLLDGAALLVGLVGGPAGILPGVVAFAVDFTNGTIYLPPGGRSALERHAASADTELEAKEVIDQVGETWLEISLPEAQGGQDDFERLSKALSDYTGQQVTLRDVVWLQDMAALRAARSELEATAAR